MLQGTLPAGFIAPCLLSKTDKLPSGSQWLHEIKHDGFRVIARKNGAQVRLYSRPGNDLTFEDRTHDGRKYRMLNVLDEFTHECLAIRVARKLKAIDVIDVLSDLFILRGVPAHIRSDNGPEFVAKAVQEWIAAVGAKTAYIERGSPWENGCS